MAQLSPFCVSCESCAPKVGRHHLFPGDGSMQCVPGEPQKHSVLLWTYMGKLDRIRALVWSGGDPNTIIVSIDEILAEPTPIPGAAP